MCHTVLDTVSSGIKHWLAFFVSGSRFEGGITSQILNWNDNILYTNLLPSSLTALWKIKRYDS